MSKKSYPKLSPHHPEPAPTAHPGGKRAGATEGVRPGGTSQSPPLLCEPEVNAILGGESNRFLVVGGPGMGKSALCRRLKERLPESRQVSQDQVIVLRCRHGAAAGAISEAIEEAIKKGQERWLIVDDIDAVYSEEIEAELTRFNGYSNDLKKKPLVRMVAISGVLYATMEAQATRAKMAEPPTGFAHALKSSLALKEFAKIDLLPWKSANWIGEVLLSALRGHLPRLTEEESRRWLEVVQRVSGGHPTLFGETLVELEGGLTAGLKSSDLDVVASNLVSIVRATTQQTLPRALEWVRGEKLSAHEELLAALRQGAPSLGGLRNKWLLCAAGLVRPERDDVGWLGTKDWVFTTAWLEEELRGILGNAAEQPAVEARAASVPPPAHEPPSPPRGQPRLRLEGDIKKRPGRGCIRWSRGGEEGLLDLSKQPWKVLLRLLSEEGRAVAVQVMAKELDMTVPAVASAVRVLQLKLAESGFADVVVQAGGRGDGYKVLAGAIEPGRVDTKN